MLLLVTVFVTLAIYSEAIDYCKIRRCAQDSHVLCQYPISKPSNSCDVVIRSGLTDEEIDLILILHNDFRTQVYGGGETRGQPGPQPTAVNITLINWDPTLALAAQRWAEQCTNKHDSCRNTDDFDVAQSINQVSTEGDIEKHGVEWVIRKWYNEVERFNKFDVSRFDVLEATQRKVYHYSQMVWEKTTRIGCGAMRFFRALAKKFLFVCNYGPRGNYNGLPVYTIRRN